MTFEKTSTAIMDQFGQSAPYERLLAINGVTVEHIVELAQELARK